MSQLEIALFCANRQRDYFNMDEDSARKAEYDWRVADARERDQIRKDLREAQERLIRDRLWGDTLVSQAARMSEILERNESTAAERQWTKCPTDGCIRVEGHPAPCINSSYGAIVVEIPLP